jgi:uncharacterized protein (DUF58 family)
LFASLKTLLEGLDRGAWIRFFVALAGLSLAFLAAVLSTVYRQSGDVLMTAVLASVALLVAGVVGVTTVPYLARRVAISRVRDSLDYDITREGKVYFALILVIAIAALNTGNNLLFLVIAAMLAAILVSGIVSAQILRRLELDVSFPGHAFAGSPLTARLTLRNTRFYLPSFSVSVVPPKRKAPQRRLRFERADFEVPPKSWGRTRWVLPDISIRRVAEEPQQAQIFTRKAYFPFLPARADAMADVELKFPRRGRYVQDEFGVATRFPFSFLLKTRRMPVKQEIIVYPSVEPTDEMMEVLPMISGEFEAFVRGRGHDLYLIREYAAEDLARHVDWKATAKSGSLKVREFTREDERKLRLVFDNPAPGAVSEAGYESAVAMTASLAWHFAGENAELRYCAPGYKDSPDVYDFLRYLALVEPQKGVSVLDGLEVTEEYNVVVTARSRGTIPTAMWECSYFLFIGNGE